MMATLIITPSQPPPKLCPMVEAVRQDVHQMLGEQFDIRTSRIRQVLLLISAAHDGDPVAAATQMATDMARQGYALPITYQMIVATAGEIGWERIAAATREAEKEQSDAGD